MRNQALSLCLVAALAAGPFAAAELRAQARFEVMPTVEIPDGYDSWSLFLVCNPAWLLETGEAGIPELFRQYRAFGDAIGPDNLAIWFWTEEAFEPSAELTDVARSAEYCARYRLLPSKAPYVLVTTDHPDAEPPGDHFYVSLNGLDARDSGRLLAALTDQLLVTGLDPAGLAADARWQRVLAATVGVLSGVGSYFNKVSFTFNTGFFKAEITHSAP